VAVVVIAADAERALVEQQLHGALADCDRERVSQLVVALA
jgi:hypothetical protein